MTTYYALYNKDLGKFLSREFKVYADMSSDAALKQNYTSNLSNALRRAASSSYSLYTVTNAIEERFKTGKKLDQYQNFKDMHQIVKVVLEPTVVDCGNLDDSQSLNQLYVIALNAVADHYTISVDHAKIVLNLHGRCEVAAVAKTLKVAAEIKRLAGDQGLAKIPTIRKNSKGVNPYVVEVDDEANAIALKLSLSSDFKATFIRTADLKQLFVDTLKQAREEIKGRTLPGGTKVNVDSVPIENDHDY